MPASRARFANARRICLPAGSSDVLVDLVDAQRSDAPSPRRWRRIAPSTTPRAPSSARYAVHSSSARLVAGRVAEELRVPRRGVLERVGHRRREHPAVAAGLPHPRDRTLLRVVAAGDEPAAEQRRVAAGGEVRRASRATSSAVRSSPRRPLSRYAQRRSGETTYGALHVIRSNVSPSTGSKKLPSAALDVVEAVQRGVQLRVRERARIDVDRDDLAVAPRGEQRVDAAAGADVERAPAALPHGQHVARARGRRVARDVVRRIVGVAREAVGREQHVGDRDEARRAARRRRASSREPRARRAPRRPSGRARRPPPPPAPAAGGTGAGSPCRAATSAAAAPRRARPPSCPSTRPRRAGRRARPPS